MLEQWEVGNYLLGLGLISARSVMRGDVRISNNSRRNNNFQVVCEQGDSFMIKQSADTDDSGTITREAFLYQYLHNAAPAEEIRRYVPRFCSYDDGERILVLELFKNAEDLRLYHRKLGRFPAWIGAEMGRSLAAMHRGSTVDMDAFQRLQVTYFPWILSVHRQSPTRLRQMSAGSVQLIQMVQQTPELRSHLDGLLGRWKVNGLVHGDVKGSNWIVVRTSGGMGKPGLKLIDWEMAGAGDARWDVGSVFADYLSLWLFSMAVNAEEEPEQYVRTAAYPLERMQPAIRRFWRSYTSHMGLEQAEAEDFLRVAVMYAGARLVQTAYEQCQELMRVTLSGVSLLQLGLNVMQNPSGATADLLGIECEEGVGVG
jgi:hypothetical protein